MAPFLYLIIFVPSEKKKKETIKPLPIVLCVLEPQIMRILTFAAGHNNIEAIFPYGPSLESGKTNRIMMKDLANTLDNAQSVLNTAEYNCLRRHYYKVQLAVLVEDPIGQLDLQLDRNLREAAAAEVDAVEAIIHKFKNSRLGKTLVWPEHPKPAIVLAPPRTPPNVPLPPLPKKQGQAPVLAVASSSEPESQYGAQWSHYFDLPDWYDSSPSRCSIDSVEEETIRAIEMLHRIEHLGEDDGSSTPLPEFDMFSDTTSVVPSLSDRWPADPTQQWRGGPRRFYPRMERFLSTPRAATPAHDGDKTARAAHQELLQRINLRDDSASPNPSRCVSRATSRATFVEQRFGTPASFFRAPLLPRGTPSVAPSATFRAPSVPPRAPSVKHPRPERPGLAATCRDFEASASAGASETRPAMPTRSATFQPPNPRDAGYSSANRSYSTTANRPHVGGGATSSPAPAAGLSAQFYAPSSRIDPRDVRQTRPTAGHRSASARTTDSIPRGASRTRSEHRRPEDDDRRQRNCSPHGEGRRDRRREHRQGSDRHDRERDRSHQREDDRHHRRERRDDRSRSRHRQDGEHRDRERRGSEERRRPRHPSSADAQESDGRHGDAEGRHHHRRRRVRVHRYRDGTTVRCPEGCSRHGTRKP